MTNIILAIIGLFLSTTLNAQHLDIKVDKLPMGEYGSIFWPYELDGISHTREWIGMKYDPNTNVLEWKVAVERNGKFCSGAWFRPQDLLVVSEISVGTIIRVGPVDKYVVQGMQFYHEISFILPPC